MIEMVFMIIIDVLPMEYCDRLFGLFPTQKVPTIVAEIRFCVWQAMAYILFQIFSCHMATMGVQDHTLENQ